MRVGSKMPDTIDSRTFSARLGMDWNLRKFYENAVNHTRGGFIVYLEMWLPADWRFPSAVRRAKTAL